MLNRYKISDNNLYKDVHFNQRTNIKNILGRELECTAGRYAKDQVSKHYFWMDNRTVSSRLLKIMYRGEE